LGNLFADVFAERAGVDTVFIGSGSIRGKELGPLVTLGNLYEVFPYDDTLHKFTISGAQLRQTFTHIMQPENRDSEGECYQVNHGVQAVYNNAQHTLESLSLGGIPVADDGQYTIAMQGYHYKSSDANLGISDADLTALAGPQVVTTSVRDVIEEYLRSHQNLNSQIEGRLVYK
jgi:5'-nucleotidase/UDP-sugar diphosphatase